MPAAKPKAARPKKEKPPPGPDDLVRESAGVYRSGDGRFTVSQSDSTWFVVDTEQANEFGQELIRGPFPSLTEAKTALPGARNVKPLLRSASRPKRATGQPGARKPSATTPKPPSWIDRLDPKERREVKRLVQALENEGLEGAEDLVRDHRDDAAPTIATRVLEHRLRRVIEASPEQVREAAREAVRRITEILAVEGASAPRPVPRWAVVEIGPEETEPRRQIRPRP